MLRPDLAVRWLAILALLTGLAPIAAHARTAMAPEAAARLQAGLTNTADGFILPAYEEQADAAAALADAIDDYCADGGGLEVVHRTFADTFLAWQRASFVRIGPIMAEEGPLRVQLWPDPKEFSARAVRSAVRSEDAALIEPGGLAGRSIALTNLTALEHLLYDPLEPISYSCDLAHAIARHQATLAADLAEAWTPGQPFRTDFETAISGNARYADVATLVRQTLAGAVVEVDRLRKFKILRGLGPAPGQARVERTEARAAGLGLDSVAASFRALAELYDVPFGLFDIAPELGGAMDYLSLSQMAATIADSLSASDESLETIAIEDGAAAARLRALADIALRNEAFLKVGFLHSIGLTAGFTAADGD